MQMCCKRPCSTETFPLNTRRFCSSRWVGYCSCQQPGRYLFLYFTLLQCKDIYCGDGRAKQTRLTSLCLKIITPFPKKPTALQNCVNPPWCRSNMSHVSHHRSSFQRTRNANKHAAIQPHSIRNLHTSCRKIFPKDHRER